jgi:mRNA interferase HicA
MKRRELEKRLRDAGWSLIRHGGNHDIWGGMASKRPRHDEINEHLARKILRKAKADR